MQYRIGDRDPVTGLYQVIWPDGGKTLNGLKNFNAVHQTGDVVLATQRSDGMIILDSAKAIDPASVATLASLQQPISYLKGQVFNDEREEKVEDPIVIKCIPSNSNQLGYQTRQIFPALYCSNTFRVDIPIYPFFGGQLTELAPSLTRPDLIRLDTVPDIHSRIQSNAIHPSYVRMDDGFIGSDFIDGILYRQIDLKLMQKICNEYLCRYLLIANLNYPNNWTGAGNSYGTISVQRGKYLQRNNYGYVPFDLAEYNQPYMLVGGLRYGWVDNRWLCQTLDTQSREYEAMFFCIQIDMLNPYDVTFLEPIWTPPPISDNTLVLQRPQIINP
jgi:hypothetical protein